MLGGELPHYYELMKVYESAKKLVDWETADDAHAFQQLYAMDDPPQADFEDVLFQELMEAVNNCG